MSVFEFAFSLFSLLLGLSLAELLGGAARAMEARRTTPVGWLTPLLAVLMALDIVSFWSSAWLLRDRIEFSMGNMLAAAAFSGAYYFGAYLVFPRQAESTLDDHFMSVRRTVLGIILIANLTQFLVFLRLVGWAQVSNPPTDLISAGLFAVLLLTVMAVRDRVKAAWIMGVTVIVYLCQLLS